jgi:hypothetical protein
MRETLKKRKRVSIRNNHSRKRTGGVSKKYKSLRGNLTRRVHKVTITRYDNDGNLFGGGILDFIKLKINVKKIKGIIGKLNVLERQIQKELSSYSNQADQFKSMAEKTAEFQTRFIIAKRRNVIFKNYSKDTEEINKKTDKNFMVTINHLIESSNEEYKHAEKMVEKEYKEVGRDIKNFLYLSAKYQKELKKFAEVDKLRKQIEGFQIEIAHVRDKAVALEGKTDYGKAEKLAVAKYKKNKADYDYVLSLTDQNLQTVNDLQQKQSALTTTMEHYKNQFGTYKSEGYESRGAQGAIKIGNKLKSWADLTDKLAASLLGVYDKAKEIITVLEEIKTSVTKCRTVLVTVPEYYNKEANANAILWFEHDIEDMIKVVKELKKHFGDMKNEFYNQISAENMYSNYNYNSRFLRVIEIRLRFYKWMIDRAFDKDLIDRRVYKPATGGFYNLLGGSSHLPGGTSRRSQYPGRKSQKPGGHQNNACAHLDQLTLFKDIRLKHLVPSLKNITQGLEDSSNDCYNNPDKQKFKNCILNKYNRYLLAAFLNDDILDSGIFDRNKDLQKGIQVFQNVLKFLDDNNWDESTKKLIAKEFHKANLKSARLDNSILNFNSNNKLTDLFDTTGSGKPGITDQNEKALIDFINNKVYMLEFMAKLITEPNFYGVLEYDKSERSSVIVNFIEDLKTNVGTSTVSSATSPSGNSSSSKNSNTSGRYNDTLNYGELEEIKEKIANIENELEQYGINPSDDFKEIAELLYEVSKIIEDVYNSLKDDKPVNTKIKGLKDFKKYQDDIKNRIEQNDMNVDTDNDSYFEKMKDNLDKFKIEYQLMQDFYKMMKDSTNSTTARDALKELIKEDDKDKESIQKIAYRLQDKFVLEFRQKANPSSPASAPSQPSSSTTSSGVQTSQTTSSSKLTVQKSSNAEEKAKKELEKIPDWLADLDTRSKQNKDYISNILIRIPIEYPNQYKEVKEQFKEILDKLNSLSFKDGTLAQLSDDFQTMTITLIDIKAIESDLIDVKVKAEPKRLGLGNYIPEPLSLEKKSQASEDTKRINELVKGMMQNTFFEDRGDKEKDKNAVEQIFDRLLATLSKDYAPSMSLDELNLLAKPHNLDTLLAKLKKAIQNAGITPAIAQGQATTVSHEIQDSQKKFCRLINKLKDIVTDTTERNKLDVAELDISSKKCSEIIKYKQDKGRDKGKDRRDQQYQSQPRK